MTTNIEIIEHIFITIKIYFCLCSYIICFQHNMQAYKRHRQNNKCYIGADSNYRTVGKLLNYCLPTVYIFLKIIQQQISKAKYRSNAVSTCILRNINTLYTSQIKDHFRSYTNGLIKLGLQSREMITYSACALCIIIFLTTSSIPQCTRMVL